MFLLMLLKGIFDLLFASGVDVSIKFDHETEHTNRQEYALNLEKSSELSKPPIASEPTGRLFFRPELLSLADDHLKHKEEAERDFQSLQNQTLLPIYQAGEEIRGTVRKKQEIMLHLLLFRYL